MVKINYGREVPDGKNARNYYYHLGMSAYIFGDFSPKEFNLPENINTNGFVRVMDSVRHAVNNLKIALFLTAEDKLYGSREDHELKFLFENVKMIWINKTSDGYFMLDNNGVLYSVEYDTITRILMSNVNSIIVSEQMIYANDTAISKTEFRKKSSKSSRFGKFNVRIQDRILHFFYDGNPINIKKWNTFGVPIFVDINDTLYAVINQQTLKLAENVENVAIVDYSNVGTAIYWNIGSTLYRYLNGKKSQKFDSAIKSISGSEDYCFILTVDGNLYLEISKNLDDPEYEYVKLLPDHVNYKNSISTPILVKSNVYQFTDVGYSDTLLIVS